METIARTPEGLVLITKTVAKTITHMTKNRSGFISIEQIQTTINEQLPIHEQFTRKMIRRAIVKLLEQHKTDY